MRPQSTLAPLASPADAIGTPSPTLAQGAEPHGWLNTETLKTPFGDFTFKNGYPAVDIDFGPDEPKDKGNWIKTVPGKGWFPIFRFYGPTQQYFDKSWKLEDIIAVQ